MMYRVKAYFTDLQDNGHAYNPGDEFPRKGVKVSDERIAELSSDKNRQHIPLIQSVEEKKKTEEKKSAIEISEKTQKKKK